MLLPNWAIVLASVAIAIPVAMVLGRMRRLAHSRRMGLRKRETTRKLKQEWLEKLETESEVVDLAERLETMRLPQLQQQMAKGPLTSVLVTKAYLLRCLRADKLDNSVCEIVPDCMVHAAKSDEYRKKHRNQARPLEGLPISIKECLFYPGLDSTLGFGTLCFKPSKQCASIIKLLLDLGAVPIVTTNIPQTMLTYECSNPVYGETQNPRMLGRSCGGSSGGEAALHARRAVPFGIGTDIGGSVRIPAAFCGTVGLKPTKHRISSTGINNAMAGQTAIPATTGPMAPDVDGCATLFKALVNDPFLATRDDPEAIPMPFNEDEFTSTRKLKIGIIMGKTVFAPSPACRRAVEVAADLLRQRGHTVVDFPEPDLLDMCRIYYALVSADGGDNVKSFYESNPVEPRMAALVNLVKLPQFVHTVGKYLPTSRLVMMLANTGRKTVKESWHLQAQQQRMYRQLMATWRAEGFDAVLTPSNVMPACRQGTCSDLTLCCWPTFLYNLFNMPAGILPVTTVTPEDDEELRTYEERDGFDRLMKVACAASAGLPVTVQVAAPRWHEERVLRIMRELEDSVEQQK